MTSLEAIEPDAEVVKLLSEIWASNRFFRDLETLGFFGGDPRFSNFVDEEFREYWEDTLQQLRGYALVPHEMIEKLKVAQQPDISLVVESIKRLLEDRRGKVFSELEQIPPSPEKAASWLETEFLKDLEPYESLIWKGFPESKAKDLVRKYRDDHCEIRPCKKSQQSIQCSKVSNYIIALGLNGGEPDKFVNDIELDFQYDLSNIRSSWKAHIESSNPSHESMPQLLNPSPIAVCYSLWLWANSRRFLERFRSDLDQIVPLLLRVKLSNGAIWEAESQQSTQVNAAQLPIDYVKKVSYRATAFLANALLSLGQEDWIEDFVVPACSWLASEQLADGGWRQKAGLEKESADTFVTCLAIEALRRCDPNRFQTEIADGRAFLLRNQDDSGSWLSDIFADSFVTRKIVEHFQCVQPVRETGSIAGLRSTAEEFLLISKELRDRGGSSNLKMATIALAHSLEFSLYSILSASHVGIDYFEEKAGDRTIGAREGMRKLKDYLISHGSVKNSAALRFQPQLRSLLSKRDGVVHKNHSVSQIELDRWITEVDAFIVHYRSEVETLHKP